jgi:hypothetical protein
LPPSQPNGSRISPILTPGRSQSSPSSRAISALNGSTFDPRPSREYLGASSLLIARRIVSRCSPVLRLISRIDNPRTNRRRRISAHCSTPTTLALPGSLCADKPRVRRPPDSSSGGPDFNRRRWSSFHPAPTSSLAVDRTARDRQRADDGLGDRAPSTCSRRTSASCSPNSVSDLRAVGLRRRPLALRLLRRVRAASSTGGFSYLKKQVTVR